MQVDSELLTFERVLPVCHARVGQDLTLLVMRVSAEELRLKVAMYLAYPHSPCVIFLFARRYLGCYSQQSKPDAV